MQLIGHRGARGLFPENTLEGFARTIALGVDGIEIDIALTADGVPVVTHDPALNPDIARAWDGAWLADRRLIHALACRNSPNTMSGVSVLAAATPNAIRISDPSTAPAFPRSQPR